MPDEASGHDYIFAALIAWVVVVMIVAGLMFGLEREKSPNTIALVTLFGTVLIAPVVTVLVVMLKGARIAQDEVKQSVQNIEHALNGEFQPRVGDAVESIVGPRFDAIDHRLRMISQRLQQGDEQFDAIRAQNAATNARLDTLTNCDIKPAEG